MTFMFVTVPQRRNTPCKSFDFSHASCCATHLPRDSKLSKFLTFPLTPLAEFTPKHRQNRGQIEVVRQPWGFPTQSARSALRKLLAYSLSLRGPLSTRLWLIIECLACHKRRSGAAHRYSLTCSSSSVLDARAAFSTDQSRRAANSSCKTDLAQTANRHHDSEPNSASYGGALHGLRLKLSAAENENAVVFVTAGPFASSKAAIFFGPVGHCPKTARHALGVFAFRCFDKLSETSCVVRRRQNCLR